jgi:hypothetical protein
MLKAMFETLVQLNKFLFTLKKSYAKLPAFSAIRKIGSLLT